MHILYHISRYNGRIFSILFLILIYFKRATQCHLQKSMQFLFDTVFSILQKYILKLTPWGRHLLNNTGCPAALIQGRRIFKGIRYITWQYVRFYIINTYNYIKNNINFITYFNNINNYPKTINIGPHNN